MSHFQKFIVQFSELTIVWKSMKPMADWLQAMHSGSAKIVQYEIYYFQFGVILV